MVREYKYFVADAYTDLSFVGNPSGIVLTEGKMTDEEMLKAARELKHSETTCIRRLDKDIYHVRYFSPVCEVSLFRPRCPCHILDLGGARLYRRPRG